MALEQALPQRPLVLAAARRSFPREPAPPLQRQNSALRLAEAEQLVVAVQAKNFALGALAAGKRQRLLLSCCASRLSWLFQLVRRCAIPRAILP